MNVAPDNCSSRQARRCTQGFGGLFTLLLLAAVMYLPGLWSLPPVDRDEARFAEASRCMAASDDWRGYVVPMFDGKARLNKPPLIYWLQALAVRGFAGDAAAAEADLHLNRAGLADNRISAYRLPSVLGAMLAVLVTWQIGRSMFSDPVGWIAAVLLATCLVVTVDSRQARADEVLLAWTTLSQGALWMVWHRRKRPGTLWPLVFWLAMGLGILTKGPVTPAVAVLTCTGLCLLTRSWRWTLQLRPELGVIVLAALILPWLIAVGQTEGWPALFGVIVEEVLGRSVSAMEGHSGPPGYHLLLLPFTFWPGCVALLPALWHATSRGLRYSRPVTTRGSQGGEATRVAGTVPARLLRRIQSLRAGRDAEVFCLCWVLPTWLVFELVATKLPHYVLPTFPALALLFARGLFATQRWKALLASPIGLIASWGWLILCELIAVAAPLLLAAVGKLDDRGLWPWIIVAAAVNQVLVVLAGKALLAARPRRTVGWISLAAAVNACVLFLIVLPHLSVLWLSSRMVAAVAEVDPGGHRPLTATGYAEDSLVFLTDGRLKRVRLRELPAWFDKHPSALAIVDEKTLALAHESAFRTLQTFEGFNYSSGEGVRARLVELTELGRREGLGLPFKFKPARRRQREVPPAGSSGG